MKITDLRVDGFGVWSGLSVDELPDGMTLLFGQNEAGKTTLMQFVRTVLYGFSPERRRRYLPPLHGGMAGGCLYVTSPSGDLEVQRHIGPNGDETLGDIALTDTHGTVRGQPLLDSLLAGVDEPIFNNVFAVGLREIQELGTLDDTQAAELLYKLTSGLDRVSLVDVMQELKSSRERLLSPDGHSSQIDSLIERHSKLSRELESLSSQGRTWAQAHGQRMAMQKEIAELERAIERAEQRSRVVDVAVQIRKDWQTRATLDGQLSAMGPLPDLSDDDVQRIDRLNAAIRKRRRGWRQAKQHRAVLKQQALAMPINRVLWSQAARIEALGEQSSWLTSLESQIERLHGEVALLDDEFNASCERLGLPTDAISNNLPDISRRTLSMLSKPARRMREDSRRLAQARSDREVNRIEAERLHEQLRAELAEHGQGDLAEALENAGNTVTKLRRRLQLEERIDKMTRDREELQEDIDQLLDRQILPVWLLVVLGVPFVLGVMLILSGIFLPGVLPLGWVVALLGLGGWGVAVAMKFLLERNASRELNECEHQLERLREALKQAKQERDDLDRELPAGGGQLDSRLEAAEKELRELETLLPLENERQTAHQRAEAANERATQATEGLANARRRWQNALRAVGLPEELSPKNVRELTDRCDQISDIRLRRDARREELQQRQNEYTTVCGRIEQLCVEADVEVQKGEPLANLRRLTATLAEHQQFINRRRELSRQNRMLRRQQAHYQRSIDKLHRKRADLLAGAGVNDEDELRRIASLIHHARSLHRQRGELTENIFKAIAGRCTEEELVAEFADRSPAALEQHREELEFELESARERVAELHARRGELTQQLKSLAADRRLDDAKLELGCIEQQLKEAIHRWMVFGVSSLILDSIREVYETERQPETLKEASGYLDQLTQGQYTRVWTPMSENVLRVDNAEGQSLPIEILSCGTREAVFLSLRLALVASYARRGAVLPLILDDVLVNLDADRAKAAAKVLRDFAKSGHQLLLFTCHEHIMKVFKSLKVEIRQLPNHSELAMTAADEEVIEEDVEDELYDGEEDEDFEEAADEEHEDETEEEVAEEEMEEEEYLEEDEEDYEDDLQQEDEVDDDEEELVAEEDLDEDIEEVEEQEEEVFAWDGPERLWEEEADEAA